MATVPKPKTRRPSVGNGDGKSADPLEGMDAEEARIYQQSIPKEEVTRDFLQELLDEHRGNKRPSGGG